MDENSKKINTDEQLEKLLGLLKFAIENKGTDLHLATGSRVLVRLKGQLRQIDTDKFSEADIKNLCLPVLSPEELVRFNQRQFLTKSFVYPKFGQFRLKLFRQKNGLSATIRVFPEYHQSLANRESLKGLLPYVSMKAGLILVTGVPCSGVTSTVASLLTSIAESRRDHIVTFDDASEIKICDSKAHVTYMQGLCANSVSDSIFMDQFHLDSDVIAVGKLDSICKMNWVTNQLDLGKLVVAEVEASTSIEAIKKLIQIADTDQRQKLKSKLAQYLLVVTEQALQFDQSSDTISVPLARFMMTSDLSLNLFQENYEELRKAFLEQTGCGTRRLVANGAVYYDELVEKNLQVMSGQGFVASTKDVSESASSEQDTSGTDSDDEVHNLDLPDVSGVLTVGLSDDILDKLTSNESDLDEGSNEESSEEDSSEELAS